MACGIDSYLLGALTPFVLEEKGEQDCFEVTDKNCTLYQLFKVRDLYQDFVKQRLQYMTYGAVNSFKCKRMKNLILFYLESIESFSDLEKWKFITGLIDTSSELSVKNDDLLLKIFCPESFLFRLQNFIQIPGSVELESKPRLVYTFTNVIDLFGKLIDSSKEREFNLLICEKYPMPQCKVYKRDPNAIIPHKTRLSDVGYDIHIIRKHSQFNNSTSLYDTGIALKIPLGYYVEIVPRSSLSKSGYILSNSVGIIDRSYRGNLFIALTKVTDDAIDIESQLPFKCCQLIFKRQSFIELCVESEEDTYTQSTRDQGGFGSTGN